MAWTTIDPIGETTDYDDLDYVNPSSNLTNGTEFCGREYAHFLATYIPNERLYDVNMSLCCFGVVANVINIIIFTRKNMNSPTNTILIGLSLSDLIRSVMFIPDFIAQLPHFKITYPYFQAVSYIIYWNIIAIFHPVSVLMTLALGIWRYIAVLYPLKSRSMCTMGRAQIIVVSIFVFNILLCLPNYFALVIKEKPSSPDQLKEEDSSRSYMGFCNEDYCAERSDFSKANDYIRKFNIVMHSIGFRILPCVILSFVTIRLFQSLKKSAKTRNLMVTYRPTVELTAAIMGKNLNGNSNAKRKISAPNVTVNSVQNGELSNRGVEKEKRITKMLIAVLSLFLFTEAPIGVMIIAFLLIPFEIVLACTRHLGVLSVIIIQLSGSLNFIVYLYMSQNYRRALVRLFLNLVRRGRQEEQVTQNS